MTSALKIGFCVIILFLGIVSLCFIGDYCRLYGGGSPQPVFEEISSSKETNNERAAFVDLTKPMEVKSAATPLIPPPPQQSFVVCKEGKKIKICPFISANFGKGRGYERNYNTFGAYISPGGCCCCLPFLDARIHYFTDGRVAANLGWGVRYQTLCQDVLGINAYYDYREECWGGFHQMGLGAEIFTRCFDLRLNTYFPLTRKRCPEKCIFDDYEGNFFVTCQTCKFAMKGADAEISKNLFGCGSFCFNGGIGPYYIADVCDKQIYGGKIRLSAKYRSNIFFDLYGTYDKFYGKKLYGKLTISIPFEYLCSKRGQVAACKSCCKLEPCCNPVYRNDMILLRQRCLWDWNYCDDFDCGCNHDPMPGPVCSSCH